VSLDYISRYEAASAKVMVDRIEAVVAETRQTGFHSSTRPRRPSAEGALRRSCRREGSRSPVGQHPLREDVHPELCRQLAESGCIAISGGLEVASERLLKLMKKGVSVARWRASPAPSPMRASWSTPT